MAGWKEFWRRYRRKSSAVAGLVLLGLILSVAAIGPLLVPGDPWAIVARPFLWPGQDAAHPLGSDLLGRDILRGIVHGARVSLLIGLSATVAALGIGVTVGACAGYFRGWIDDALMRVTELFQTMPNFLLAIVLVALFRASIVTIVLAISAVSWPAIARLVRGQFLSLREREFVQSCVVVGMGETRIIVTQILPNCLAPIVVMSSIMVASAILTEVRPLLPRARRSRPDDLGNDDRHWPPGAAHGLVHGDAAGHCHPAHGAGPEPGQRRAERRAQPASEESIAPMPALLEVRDLRVQFATPQGSVTVVDRRELRSRSRTKPSRWSANPVAASR